MVKSTFDLIQSMCNVGLASSPWGNGAMPTGPGRGSDFCANRTGLGPPVPASPQQGSSSLSPQTAIPRFPTINPGENERTRALPGGVSQPRVARQEQPSKGKVQSYFPSLNISCGTDPALPGHYPQVKTESPGIRRAFPRHEPTLNSKGKYNSPKQAKRCDTNQPLKEPQNRPH